MTTDKNKEQFEKWYYEKQNSDNWHLFITFSKFLKAPFEMQVGVYLAYYDSLGYHLFVKYSIEVDWMYSIEVKQIQTGIGGYKTRNDAYKAGINELNEMANNPSMINKNNSTTLWDEYRGKD